MYNFIYPRVKRILNIYFNYIYIFHSFCYYSKKNFLMAGEDTETAILLDPAGIRGYTLKALILAECMNFDGAITAAKVALGIEAGRLI